MSGSSLICCENVTVVRPDGRAAIRDLTWSVRAGETWAVVGPVGSGKTTLLETLLGRRRVTAGTLTRPAGPLAFVPFQEDVGRFSYARHYYQQRFNFVEEPDDVPLREFLGPAAWPWADRLGLGGRLDQSVIQLSNGQMRRARLARSLAARPEWLLLDDPFLGLDAAGRDDLSIYLDTYVRSGGRLILTADAARVPAWVTHRLELPGPGPRVTPPDQASPPPPIPSPAPVVELRDVTVGYPGRPILDGLTWTVRRGERWAVLGPNGAGKSTLLSLLCGDHPQAYAQDVRLFGRRRGTGETIWDVKRRVGLSSPELHLYFRTALTAARVAATGFHDVLTDRPTTPAQDARVACLFGELGIGPLLNRPFNQLSTGEARLVLLVRAVVKEPELLILDEPFQAIDSATARAARRWLDRVLTPDQALVFVTHHAEEIPDSVTRTLRLEPLDAAGRRPAE
jgi:molybdate transport system ATP-binding protein